METFQNCNLTERLPQGFRVTLPWIRFTLFFYKQSLDDQMRERKTRVKVSFRYWLDGKVRAAIMCEGGVTPNDLINACRDELANLSSQPERKIVNG